MFFQAQTTWKAAPTERFQSISQVKKVLGVLKSQDKFKLPEKNEYLNAFQLPTLFDSREEWPHCKSISEIRDQSNCGSCWVNRITYMFAVNNLIYQAFGAVEAMTDRYCIHSNGSQRPRISAEDLLSCCGSRCGDGCDGGYPSRAWEFWVNEGLVTGGEYNGHQGCRDYAFPKCSHHVKSIYPNCTGDVQTPKCEKQCQSGYPFTYFQDKHYGKLLNY